MSTYMATPLSTLKKKQKKTTKNVTFARNKDLELDLQTHIYLESVSPVELS